VFPPETSPAEDRANRIPRAVAGLHVRNDVNHVGIALDRREFVYPDRTGLGHATHVVAPQIDQHEMFGALLRIREQLLFERPIFLGRAPARAGSRDGADVDLTVLETHENLGRGADQHRPLTAHEEEIRARVDRAEVAVERERIDLERDSKLLREHDLEDVARLDVALGALDDLVEGLSTHAAPQVHGRAHRLALRLGPERLAQTSHRAIDLVGGASIERSRVCAF